MEKKMKNHKVRVSFMLWLWALAAIVTAPLTLAGETKSEYRVGVVPQFDARRIVEVWQPLLDAVGERAGVRLRLQPAPSIPAFEGELNQGSYDFAYMNPYHLLIANKAQGYLPLWRDHGRQLQGVLVVRKDSPIESLAQLAGKTVAFPAPNALGATLMMRAELQGQHGLQIEPRFVKSHSSVYLNVATGAAAAGGGVQKTLNQQPQQVKDALRVLHRTQGVAPHPLAAHPRVDPAMAKRVQQAFLQLGEGEEGKALMSGIPMKQIGVATLEEYLLLQSLGLDAYYHKE